MTQVNVKELVKAARALEKGQGLEVTPGGNIKVTRPYIERHSLVSTFSDPDIALSYVSDKGRKNGGYSSKGRTFKRKAPSSVIKYKDLNPKELIILDLMARVGIEICTLPVKEVRDTKYGKLNVYEVVDTLRNTVYEVITSPTGNILFINEPDKEMAHPIPSYLHKLRY